MRAGQLDRTIVVQEVSTTAINDVGTPAPVWSTVVTLRAQLVQAATAEFIRDGARDETIIIFRTRYVDEITTAHRIIYEGKIHNIKELKEIGRRRGLEIRTLCVGDSA